MHTYLYTTYTHYIIAVLSGAQNSEVEADVRAVEVAAFDIALHKWESGNVERQEPVDSSLCPYPSVGGKTRGR